MAIPTINDIAGITADPANKEQFWGGCGSEGCAECLPLFDCFNQIISGTNV